MIQMPPSSSYSSSRKWLPPPSVPSCRAALGPLASAASRLLGVTLALISASVRSASGSGVLCSLKPAGKELAWYACCCAASGGVPCLLQPALVQLSSLQDGHKGGRVAMVACL